MVHGSFNDFKSNGKGRLNVQVTSFSENLHKKKPLITRIYGKVRLHVIRLNLIYAMDVTLTKR